MDLEEHARELFGEALDGLDASGRFAKVRGKGWVYLMRPDRELTFRHELMTELASTGMHITGIKRLLTKRQHTADGGYYNKLLKNPRLQAKVQEKMADATAEARGILKRSVVTAANNVKEAVDNKDLGMSKYVLDNYVVEKKPSGVQQVNFNFGKWLSGAVDTKTIDVESIEYHEEEPVDIADDVDSVEPQALAGERLGDL